MKTTSKRKRSSKSGPVAEAVASVEAAPTAASPEPAPVEVIATASANEPVVAEEVVAEVDANAETVSVESVVADAAVAVSEPVVVEAVVVEAEGAPVEATPVDSVIVLAANCSVKDAASLKTSLCALANESAAVTLDASAVERVDTATMQLLCAFARDRNARKQSIVWRGQSQALHDAIRLLGVGSLLGFDAGVAA
jgi:ABC-type transporter Mla MlaB component